MAKRSQTSPVETTALQKQSYQAGLVCGQNPATPYGIPTPEGLDSVAFAAGLIEGRSQVMSRGQRALSRWFR